jgi:hypothetical protein
MSSTACFTFFVQRFPPAQSVLLCMRCKPPPVHGRQSLLLFDRAAGLLSPRPQILPPARTVRVKAGCVSAATEGWALIRPSTMADWFDRGPAAFSLFYAPDHSTPPGTPNCACW